MTLSRPDVLAKGISVNVVGRVNWVNSVSHWYRRSEGENMCEPGPHHYVISFAKEAQMFSAAYDVWDQQLLR